MKIIQFIFIISCVLWLQQAEAGDTNSGQHLVGKHCQSCHGSEIYTRENRRVQSKQQLASQVKRCELSLGLKWFDEDIEQVADYLNLQFYHFP